jgi:hypothetical protein
MSLYILKMQRGRGEGLSIGAGTTVQNANVILWRLPQTLSSINCAAFAPRVIDGLRQVFKTLFSVTQGS